MKHMLPATVRRSGGQRGERTTLTFVVTTRLKAQTAVVGSPMLQRGPDPTLGPPPVPTETCPT